MTGRNIKVPGHGLKPADSDNPFKWECYCGAWGRVLSGLTPKAREHGRRNEHDAHKIEVLRKQGKLREEE
jgi:hypothetical protein